MSVDARRGLIFRGRPFAPAATRSGARLSEGPELAGPHHSEGSISMSIKLSDTQLVMLSAAAQRDDHCLTLPKKLKGGAAHKVATKLIAAGLIKEVEAKTGMPVWRRDEQDGQPYGLRLTAAGAKAIAVNPNEDASPPEMKSDRLQRSTNRQRSLSRIEPLLERSLRPAPRCWRRLWRRGWERSWRRRLRCFEPPRGRRSPSCRKRWAGCRIPPALS